MPKIVDHGARRRLLAKTIMEVAAHDGLAAATLRAVAQRSGMSMGSVQHYFADREQMLNFVLSYVQERRTARIVAAVEDQQAATPKQILNTLIAEVLTEDDDNLLFERVRTMFLDRAIHHPPTARILNEGAKQVTHLLHGLFAQIDAGVEGPARIDAHSTAQLLWSMIDGLPATVALGQRSMTDARALTYSLLYATIGESVPDKTACPMAEDTIVDRA